jgi:hypothetical protein
LLKTGAGYGILSGIYMVYLFHYERLWGDPREGERGTEEVISGSHHVTKKMVFRGI